MSNNDQAAQNAKNPQNPGKQAVPDKNGKVSDPLKQAEDEKTKKETDKLKDQKINEYGQATLNNNNKKIHLMTIIGEVEGHECLPQHNKTTKYEHILPQLASIEDSKEVEGVLILLNTVGGDVEAGLAIAEMIASLSKPTVSLVLGGSHSIGVPLAVSADYSFIVPTATMIIHPVRMNGTVIGVAQTYEYFQKIQNRILSFIVDHSGISYDDVEALMLNTTQLVKDFGTILVGKEAVEHNIINEVGGIDAALKKLNEMMDERRKENSAPEVIIENQESLDENS